MSYVQLRGSVPLFWDEGGQQPFGVKVTITRPIEASLPAFLKHFDDLTEEYSEIHVLNLLAQKDLEEGLTRAYETHLAAASQVDDTVRTHVEMTNFDFHARSRIGGIESVRSQLGQVIGPAQQQFGACVVSVNEGVLGSVVVGQQGAFRTNCRDCLDRTNVVEDVLSKFALEEFLRSLGPSWSGKDTALWAAHRVLFAENGDALSRSYVGTGALNTSFTRSGKRSFAGLLSDAAKSAGRVYQAALLDDTKQRSIDALLGHLPASAKVRVFDPVQDEVRLRLRNRRGEYESRQNESIWVGTYNVNGKSPGSESLLPWLMPQGESRYLLAILQGRMLTSALLASRGTEPAGLCLPGDRPAQRRADHEYRPGEQAAVGDVHRADAGRAAGQGRGLRPAALAAARGHCAARVRQEERRQ